MATPGSKRPLFSGRESREFNPRILDRTVIAIPLLEKINAEREQGSARAVRHVIIDLNLNFEGGRAKAVERIRKLSSDVVRDLKDPVGAVMERWTRPNGMTIERVRVPLGVVGIIYESRPNVTADAGVLCLKAGNAAVLRGGKEAIETNAYLADLIGTALKTSGLNSDSVSFIRNTDREVIQIMKQQTDLIDLIIPRGGKSLARSCARSSTSCRRCRCSST